MDRLAKRRPRPACQGGESGWTAKGRDRAVGRPPVSLQGPSGPLLAAGGNRPGIYAGSGGAANWSFPLDCLAVILVHEDPGLWTAAARRPVNGPDRANQHQSNPFSGHRTRHECRADHRLKPETGVNARPWNNGSDVGANWSHAGVNARPQDKGGDVGANWSRTGNNARPRNKVVLRRRPYQSTVWIEAAATAQPHSTPWQAGRGLSGSGAGRVSWPAFFTALASEAGSEIYEGRP